MTRFRDKYRVESARLPNWDYAGPGWYFVTICTKDRQCFFGDIVDGEMWLSPIGEIVAEEWQKTPEIRPNVVMDEWVIMPNHLHGIVVITTPVETSRRGGVETSRRDVSTPSQLKAGSLGAIIGQIKSVCTKRIWAAGYSDFAWQSRFYDHVIRDEASLQLIREYIANNPVRWAEDENNPTNLARAETVRQAEQVETVRQAGRKETVRQAEQIETVRQAERKETVRRTVSTGGDDA